MVRAKGRYRNQAVELEQPLPLPEGADVEVEVYPSDEVLDLERQGWASLAMDRLQQE